MSAAAGLAPRIALVRSRYDPSGGAGIIAEYVDEAWGAHLPFHQDLPTWAMDAGADVCVVDGSDLAERVRAATGGASIRLGLDAVSGQATARISACVGEGGVVCNYGSMSGEDPVMPRGKLIGDGQSLVGFILGRALAPRSRAQVREIYAEHRAEAPQRDARLRYPAGCEHQASCKGKTPERHT